MMGATLDVCDICRIVRIFNLVIGCLVDCHEIQGQPSVYSTGLSRSS